MFTTVNEHEPLKEYVLWLSTDTLRNEARMVECLQSIMEKLDSLVSATKLLHEQEKGKIPTLH